ncbi:insulinase family protein [Acinetobacter guillouiae]|uniref:Insulinase family protein n=1 Tax=Acinetobacter guillouiae TaxID=106649 RepID=A0A8X8KEH0_ACIGI|nr:insulinase family protein [Acinetobacter guillouiae]MCF0263855.1 insulinase family protein [Acinetobacter guillouiae]
MNLSHQLSSSTLVSHPAFEFVRQHNIDSVKINVQQYRHKVTGAIHYHLVADHVESAFLVALRTQPMDSKGAAHILEHTVLCGSMKFPVRDPFFAMTQRSLNTFMNAMTSSDWTAFPFATQNNKDFQNLLAVYLDAVFAPNIHPLDFAQEGIRVELNENNKPIFKGVVFNEMKGALSSSSRQLYHSLAESLYSETTYHYNSGGEPAEITELKHDELVKFYKKHYHPSNAIFMTFGKQNVYDLHEQFENLALTQFEHGETLFSQPEPRLVQPKQIVKSYAIEGNDLADKTYLTLSWLLPSAEDIQLWFGLRLMSGFLLQNSASPLQYYLETCGYAQSVGPIVGLDDRNYEMAFYCGVQGANPENAEQFLQEVLKVLTDIASKPVDSQVIDGLLYQIELEQREISGGMPYGLNLFFSGLSRAIHHEDPIQIWDIDQALIQIKKKIKDDPMWISKLIQTYLLDNTHRILLTFIPDNEKLAQIRQTEHDKLVKIEESLTVQDRESLLQQALFLKQRQESQDDQNILPKVTLADVPSEIYLPQGEIESIEIAGTQHQLHIYPTGTNGLYYQQVLIDIPDDVLQSPYFPIYTSLVGQLGAGEYDYLQLQQLQTAVSGGLWMNSSLRCHVSDKNKISRFLVLSTKSLTQKYEAIELLKLTFEKSRFDEKSRILELLQQQKIQWQSSVANNGEAYAIQSATRQMSALAVQQEAYSGLVALNGLSKLLDDITYDETAYNTFRQQLQAIHSDLLKANKQFLIVCEASQKNQLKKALQQQWATFNTITSEQAIPSIEYQSDVNNQAWLIQGNVQFCAQAYPAVTIDHVDAAVFMVLGPYLKNGFLHHAIREQGGAYGCGANYDPNTCAFYFFSSRDPRLAETFADFDASLQWLLQQNDDPQSIESAILTVISAMDKPGSPASEAISACHSALHGRTATIRQRLRQQILKVTMSDLKRIVTDYLGSMVVQRSVVAPLSKIKQVKELGFEIHKVA